MHFVGLFRLHLNLCVVYCYLNNQYILIVLIEVRHNSDYIDRLLSGTILLNTSVNFFLMLEILFHLFQWQAISC